MKKWTIGAFAAGIFMAAAMLRPVTAAPINLDGTLIAHQALTTSAIDLYPEYTGTALCADIALGAAMVEKAHRMNIGQKLRFA